MRRQGYLAAVLVAAALMLAVAGQAAAYPRAVQVYPYVGAPTPITLWVYPPGEAIPQATSGYVPRGISEAEWQYLLQGGSIDPIQPALDPRPFSLFLRPYSADGGAPVVLSRPVDAGGAQALPDQAGGTVGWTCSLTSADPYLASGRVTASGVQVCSGPGFVEQRVTVCLQRKVITGWRTLDCRSAGPVSARYAPASVSEPCRTTGSLRVFRTRSMSRAWGKTAVLDSAAVIAPGTDEPARRLPC